MGLAHSPSIVRDGLVLHLDAANTKCYPPDNLEVEYLIVAGGGAGGDNTNASTATASGAGGAGGLLTGFTTVSPQNYTITVGDGGVGGDGNIVSGGESGENGGNSSAFGLTAIGGGGGGSRFTGPNSGGSGGGGGYGSTTTQALGASGIPEQGNDGGDGSRSPSLYASGGGGGAGSAGEDAPTPNIAGNGGQGILSTITGTSTFYAGGGGGSLGRTGTGTIGIGGLGGGGDGANNQQNGKDATPNTGGGGGGGSDQGTRGGAGGSGVVIVRYKGPQKATGGDSVYQSGPYTVHVFNNSGNFVVGNTAGDISGNQNTGALTNGVTFNSANGGSFDFDGVDDHILIDPVLPAGQSAYTIDAFFYQDSSTDNISRVIFEQNSSSLTQHTRGCLLVISSGKWGFNGQSNDAHDKVPVDFNSWQHAVVVVNTTDGVNPIKLYKNGSLYWQGDSSSGASNLSLGAYKAALGFKIPTSGEYWDSKIGTLKIYNRALTAAEIAQNFEATRGRYGI